MEGVWDRAPEDGVAHWRNWLDVGLASTVGSTVAGGGEGVGAAAYGQLVFTLLSSSIIWSRSEGGNTLLLGT